MGAALRLEGYLTSRLRVLAEYEVADPPTLLYVKGRAELLGRPSLAIVGSRNATAQGVANAEAFAKANGATDQEVAEAVGLAALTRHWSTVLNGSPQDILED